MRKHLFILGSSIIIYNLFGRVILAKKGKAKTVFFCTECGNESVKLYGQCPSCGQWNTMKEMKLEENSVRTAPSKKSMIGNSSSIALSDIKSQDEPRTLTNIEEFDRVLGGGLVKGSLILLGGDPGIGKSTMLMQISHKLSKQQKVLYISGEESSKQLKLRCDRINVNSDNILVITETRMQEIINEIEKVKPDVVIADSIQTMYKEDVSGLPGNVTQIRECTLDFMNIAKGKGISVFLIGHVTKDGQIAGPKVLEHIVDTVLYFEGDRDSSLKLLRSVKNRFGSNGEVGIFKMESDGMHQVLNPSDVMLDEYKFDLVGTTVTSLYEGSRPILVELQALVTQTYFTMPRRTAEGIDLNKVYKIIAVLEKRMGLILGNKDIYINVVGGMKLNEPGIELSLGASIFSSLKNIVFPKKTAFLGEIGLSGEIRGVKNISGRVSECAKFGIEQVIVPTKNLPEVEKYSNKIKITGADNIKVAIEKSFQLSGEEEFK